MIDGLRPYSAYKDASAPWLGSVPDHWAVTRARYLIREVDVRSKTGAEAHLSMSQRLGLVPSSEIEERRLVSESYVGAKLCETADLVLNRLKAHLGVFARASQAGLVSPDYTVLRRVSDGVVMTFLEYVLRSSPCRTELRTRAKGLVEGFWRLYTDDFYQIKLPAPPISEQNAIVRLLDHVDRRVQRYIRAKRKLIALLNEQKQAIINQAGTRGLDPGVRLRPTGVAWLGDMPAHWQIQAFTRCAIEIADYRGATPVKTENGVFLITARNVRKGWIDYEVSREFVAATDYAKIMRRGLPRLGDLLLTMEAPLGNAALVDREDIALAQRIVRFRFEPSVLDQAFVLLFVLSAHFQNQLLRRGTGSTAQGIKASKLPQLQLLLPPLAEQRALVGWVGTQCDPLDRMKKRAESQIELLLEYRDRLVADMVTGKLDVREAAARLPDEADEPELVERDDAVDEDEAAADAVLDGAAEEAEV